jgi:hypothetical protein
MPRQTYTPGAWFFNQFGDIAQADIYCKLAEIIKHLACRLLRTAPVMRLMTEDAIWEHVTTGYTDA